MNFASLQLGGAGLLNRIYEILSKIKKSILYRKMNYNIKTKRGNIVKISVSDLLHLYYKNSKMQRLDIIVRICAIENYYGLNIDGFKIYEKAQSIRKNKDFAVEAAKKFRQLIKSYENYGYDKDSLISLDNELKLIDGSHRIAMAIYHRFPTINALIVPDNYSVDYSVDWFIKEDFPDTWLKVISEKENEIWKRYKDSIVCIIWGPAVKWTEEIIKDLTYYGIVAMYKKLHYSENEYQNIVRKIYSIDDIAEWKIDKKLEYMTGHTDIVFLELEINAPQFRIKKISNLPICINGERLKKAIRGKYSNKIENYYYDIIFHTADNYTQSQQIRDIIEDSYEKKCI